MYHNKSNNFKIEMNGSAYRILEDIKVPANKVARRGVLK